MCDDGELHALLPLHSALLGLPKCAVLLHDLSVRGFERCRSSNGCVLFVSELN